MNKPSQKTEDAMNNFKKNIRKAAILKEKYFRLR